jgi:ribosomal protein S18 acetylase RimI-like enzyme
LLYIQKLIGLQTEEFKLMKEFSHEKLFEVMFENHIRGIANQKGKEYLQAKKYENMQETYYMKNSAVIAEYRNKGVYSKMLDFVIKELQREGFQVVTSIHHGNNPAVLIPKLKKGFVISGTEFHEKFRFLVELKLFFNEERKKAYGKSMGLEL